MISRNDFDVQATRGPDRLSVAKQSAGILVHGGLRPAELSRHEDRVLQHVRATDHEWTVRRQYSFGRKADEIPCPRPAQSPRGLCSEVRG